MNRGGSDKHPVCHNALQTSLIREQIKRRISSTINCEIPKTGAKVHKNSEPTKKTSKKVHFLRRFSLQIGVIG
jgi:hypothetical protein